MEWDYGRTEKVSTKVKQQPQQTSPYNIYIYLFRTLYKRLQHLLTRLFETLPSVPWSTRQIVKNVVDHSGQLPEGFVKVPRKRPEQERDIYKHMEKARVKTMFFKIHNIHVVKNIVEGGESESPLQRDIGPLRGIEENRSVGQRYNCGVVPHESKLSEIERVCNNSYDEHKREAEEELNDGAHQNEESVLGGDFERYCSQLLLETKHCFFRSLGARLFLFRSVHLSEVKR